jgi:hypothetical protein
MEIIHQKISWIKNQNLPKFLQTLVKNKQKLPRSRLFKFRPQIQNMNFLRSLEKFWKKMCLNFFESSLKRKLGKHRREIWLTSSRYFEVLVVNLKQTLFFHLILRKIFANFFVVIWVVLCF